MFEQFIGQTRIKEHLRIVLLKAQTTLSLDHILLTGASGYGKTTLARLIATYLKWTLLEYDMGSKPVTEVLTDIIDKSMNNKKYKNKAFIYYLDEVHLVKNNLDNLLKVMEQKGLKGYPFNFTIIAATNKQGYLPEAFLNRFGLKYQLEKYTDEDMKLVVKLAAKEYGVELDNNALNKIVAVSRKVPRVAKNILKRCSDFGSKINNDIVSKTLYYLGIDDTGLTLMDLSYMKAIEVRKNKPQSLKNLSVLTDEEAVTIENVIEPYLIERGFIDRTPQGRILTPEGLEYLGSDLPSMNIKDILKSLN